MKRLALALATTAILGFAAPAFAADSDMSGNKTQTQTPSGQTSSPSAQSQTPSQTPSAQSQTPSATQTPSAQNQTPSSQMKTPSAQNQSPSMQNKTSAQAEVKGKAAKSKVSSRANHKVRMAHHRRGTSQLARHERGLKGGHYYAYVKPQHRSLHHKKTTHY